MNYLNSHKDISQNETLEILDKTSQLAAQQSISFLSNAAIAAQSSNSLTNNVEFWKWMGRNYDKSEIFDSVQSMQEYISRGPGKEEWVLKQLQGKGYEWDWMTVQRNNIKNLFQRFDAGDVATRAASDVTKTDLLSGKSIEYQHKAYTSKTNPDLSNTPKDMTVVTNKEKVDVVRKNGYKNVEEFQDSETILSRRQERMDEIKSGKVNTSYNIRNVTGAMAKSGAIGAVIGMGTESIALYSQYKLGELTDEQYLIEILKAGCDAGTVAAATSGIMIPVSATIIAAGISAPITIPIAIVIGGVVGKIVSPCFGRGEYRKVLSEAKYYQNLNLLYTNLITSMDSASEQYYNYICGLNQQVELHKALKSKSSKVNQELSTLYNSI